jgi:hypothetical protein
MAASSEVVILVGAMCAKVGEVSSPERFVQKAVEHWTPIASLANRIGHDVLVVRVRESDNDSLSGYLTPDID